VSGPDTERDESPILFAREPERVAIFAVFPATVPERVLSELVRVVRLFQSNATVPERAAILAPSETVIHERVAIFAFAHAREPESDVRVLPIVMTVPERV
jgi:hypothetical protein